MLGRGCLASAWVPQIALQDGITKTIEYFGQLLKERADSLVRHQ